METKDTVCGSYEKNVKSESEIDDTSANKINIQFLVLSVHFNAFLYSTCFWIQLNTLPVSCV